jgi:hypothetical protein
MCPQQRPLPDNTQHSQETDIYTSSGIRTRNPSKRAAVDSRLRPLGHWDWRRECLNLKLLISYFLKNVLSPDENYYADNVVYFFFFKFLGSLQPCGPYGRAAPGSNP